MLCLSKVAICFPKMKVLLFVWCRAYVPLYLVSMDPSKDWLDAPLSDFDSIGNS